MKVVILGARGMLGSELRKVFSDVDMVAWDKEELDITDEEQVLKKLTREGPELVINAAAYTDVDGAESDREGAFLLNEKAVGIVGRSAESIGAGVVHYSTDYVFPGVRKGGYEESEEAGPPVNVYGESKLAGEKMLRDATQSHYLIRTSWLYGAGGNNFVNTMLMLAKERDELNVVNDQHGSPTYAKDVAMATRRLIDDEFGYDTYHLVSDGVTTWFDFAVEIFKQAGLGVKVKPVSSKEFERPAARPEYSMLKNTKGPKIRGWRDALYDYISDAV